MPARSRPSRGQEGGSVRSPAEVQIGDVVGLYLAYLQARAAPSTLRQARASLARVVAGMEIKVVRDVTRARAEVWSYKRTAAGASNRTANAEIGYLRAALGRYVRSGQLKANPLANLDQLPTTARHRVRQARALSEDEIGKLIKAAVVVDKRTGGVPREPLLRALICTGARWSELTRATWADVDLRAGLIELRAEHTKSQRGRVLPLDAEMVAHLGRLRSLFTQPSERVFLTPHGCPWGRDTANFLRYFYALLDRAGIKRVDESGRCLHAHALRHTCGTRLARAGVHIAATAKMLGHAPGSPLTAGVYTHLDVADLQAAIARIPSIGATKPEQNAKVSGT